MKGLKMNIEESNDQKLKQSLIEKLKSKVKDMINIDSN